MNVGSVKLLPSLTAFVGGAGDAGGESDNSKASPSQRPHHSIDGELEGVCTQCHLSSASITSGEKQEWDKRGPSATLEWGANGGELVNNQTGEGGASNVQFISTSQSEVERARADLQNKHINPKSVRSVQRLVGRGKRKTSKPAGKRKQTKQRKSPAKKNRKQKGGVKKKKAAAKNSRKGPKKTVSKKQKRKGGKRR